jgi:hypothetical protein
MRISSTFLVLALILANELGRLARVPVDIAPRFVTAETLAR